MCFLILAFPKNQVPGRRLRTLFLRKACNKKLCFLGEIQGIFTVSKGRGLECGTLARPWPRLLWSQPFFIAKFGRFFFLLKKDLNLYNLFDDVDFVWDFLFLSMYIKPLVFFTQKKVGNKKILGLSLLGISIGSARIFRWDKDAPSKQWRKCLVGRYSLGCKPPSPVIVTTSTCLMFDRGFP